MTPDDIQDMGHTAGQLATQAEDPYGGGIPFVPAEKAEELADPYAGGTFSSASESIGAGDTINWLYDGPY
jgi:hypothetical protein